MSEKVCLNAWFVCPYESDGEYRISGHEEQSYSSLDEAKNVAKEYSKSYNDEGGYYFGIFQLVHELETNVHSLVKVEGWERGKQTD